MNIDWEILPQAPNYALNSQGFLRNMTTGKWQISPRGTKTAHLYLGDGKKICVTLPHLLWQLHGRITSKRAPITVSAKKGTRYLRFDSLNDCAKFLAKVTHLTYGGAYYHLHRRHTLIADWSIHYFKQ